MVRLGWDSEHIKYGGAKGGYDPFVLSFPYCLVVPLTHLTCVVVYLAVQLATAKGDLVSGFVTP